MLKRHTSILSVAKVGLAIFSMRNGTLGCDFLVLVKVEPMARTNLRHPAYQVLFRVCVFVCVCVCVCVDYDVNNSRKHIKEVV